MTAPAAGRGPVLALNAGSSSLKATLYDDGLRRIAAREADLGRAGAGPEGQTAALAGMLAAIAAEGAPRAIGHRVVHGGPRHGRPAVVDDALVDELRDLACLAPLHMPGAIAVIEAVSRLLPGVPQVACFDTAFFRDLPETSSRLPLPRRLHDAGVRRYGFHGLSYEHVLHAVPGSRRGRVVMAHLGHGASMAAVRDGAPLETTMGFTPAGGIMMGTRPGDLDPGVLVHLAREGMDADALEGVVMRESGLLGVSGTTSDMRALLAARGADPDAALAVAMFCLRARREVGALAAVLGGLDMLVFTGGIGARSPEVRAEICGGLVHLGVALDPGRNGSGDGEVSAPGSAVTVLAVPADEDLVVARHTLAALAG